jgi:anti-sigma factor RsiW
MTRCLDEAKLQSYFDGELSIDMMESVTSHLAACVTCAAAARELEEETALLTSALSTEFEASVPTERLRERIDAAVLGDRVASAQATEKSGGLAGFFNGLLSFGTQRTLGYASLAVVLAFAAIFGIVMKKNEEPASKPTTPNTAQNQPSKASPIVTPVTAPQTGQQQTIQPSNVVATSQFPAKRTTANRQNRFATTPAPSPAPVKLIPGERSYLQTIARLDSTIKSNKKAMRPSLQVEYERNLAVVDRAIAATRSAAKSNPNDPDAADFMFAAYQSKVDLLNTIADARLSGGRGH